MYAVGIAVHTWAIDFDLRILWGIAGGIAPIVFLFSLISPPKPAKPGYSQKEA